MPTSALIAYWSSPSLPDVSSVRLRVAEQGLVFLECRRVTFKPVSPVDHLTIPLPLSMIVYPLVLDSYSVPSPFSLLVCLEVRIVTYNDRNHHPKHHRNQSTLQTTVLVLPFTIIPSIHTSLTTPNPNVKHIKSMCSASVTSPAMTTLTTLTIFR